MSDVLEQTFQQATRLALTLAKVPVKLWRQPAGKILPRQGGAVECAPPGAADLTGVCTTGSGLRLEVELKGPRTPVGEAQDTWRDCVGGWGCGYARIRYNRRRTFDENVTAAVATIDELVTRYGCVHPDEDLVQHAEGGVVCTCCGWRNGGRPREAPRG